MLDVIGKQKLLIDEAWIYHNILFCAHHVSFADKIKFTMHNSFNISSIRQSFQSHKNIVSVTLS